MLIPVPSMTLTQNPFQSWADFWACAATAQRFVQEGAYVFITGRRQSELDAAVKEIGKNVTGVQGDVSNLEDLDRLYATVKQ